MFTNALQAVPRNKPSNAITLHQSVIVVAQSSGTKTSLF